MFSLLDFVFECPLEEFVCFFLSIFTVGKKTDLFSPYEIFNSVSSWDTNHVRICAWNE